MWNFERTYSISFVQPRAQVGTHGWIVVFGACLVFIFNISLSSSFNIIFKPFFESDITSINTATYIFQILSNMTVLTTGFLLKDLSAKHFVILGSSLVFLGMLLTSIISNFGEIILTYSIIIGIGQGLVNPACFIAILSCFEKSRNLAIGIVFSAMGLGHLLMPHVAQYLIEHLDFQLAIVCMASFSFLGLIGANLLAPIKWRNHCENDDERRPLLQNSSTTKYFVVHDIIRASDLDLLSDCSYLVISIGLSFIFALSTDFRKILPSVLMEKLALSVNQAHICLHVINLSDIFARATFTFITDALEYSSKTVFIIGLVGISLFRLFILHANVNFGIIIFFCFFFGVFRAMTVVNQVLIIADFCKKRCPRKLPGTLGLSYVLKSIFLALFNFLYQQIGEDYSLHIYSHLFLQCMIIFIWCCCVT